ncbi:MAG TPA: energy transducer TonB [Flavobacterium sp.]
MKSILLTILFLLIPKSTISQVSENHKIILLDSTFNEKTKLNHPYYRIIKDYKLEKESYEISEYTDSGILITEGTTSNRDIIVKEGKFIHFYENSNIKLISNYEKGRKIGQEFKWYENGNKKEEGTYIVNKEDKDQKNNYRVNQFWDNRGIQRVTNGNGNYIEKYKNYYGSGEVKNGVKDGVWEGWVGNTYNKYTEKYENGKLVSGTIIGENNIKYTYEVLETKPEPKNGLADFHNYISQNFKAPNLPGGVNGKIWIKFSVDKDGKILEPIILKDLGYGTAEEAKRVLVNYENWNPGKQRGQNASFPYIFPIIIL